MNNQTLALLLFLASFISSCHTQDIGFEKIEYASFDINSPRTKQRDSVYINLYSVIDKNGLITILDVEDYNNKFAFYRYKLNVDQLQKINSIINNKKPLKNYIVEEETKDTGFYAGCYDYLSVTYENGSKDSLCFVQPFMTQGFNSVYEMLDDIYYQKENISKIKSFTIPLIFREYILAAFKKSTSLPEIKFIDFVPGSSH